MVSDKGPGLCFCRKEFPQSWKVVKQVVIKRTRVNYMWIDTWADSEGESVSHTLKWQYMGYFFRVSSGQSFFFGGGMGGVQPGACPAHPGPAHPFANRFYLPGSQSVFGISQDPPMCVHASLSQDNIWIGSIPWHHSPLATKDSFLCMCGQGGLLTLGT